MKKLINTQGYYIERTRKIMLRRYLLGITCGSLLAISSIQAQDKLYSNEFPVGDVKLLDGEFKKAMDLNTSVLLKYTVDRLLYPYRLAAGLSTQGASNYTNWSCTSSDQSFCIDGHVGGHYLTALAIQVAATGNAQCKERLDLMITELKKCQDANGNDPDFVGYLCGMYDGKAMWRNYKTGNFTTPGKNVVPWYNIHKTYAGLRDVYVYTGNETAKTMFLKLCDWGIKICSGLSDAQMQSMLGQEHGGIAEMYADAYQMTNDAKYLTAAKRFAHKWLYDGMVSGNTTLLDGKHANTQVPKVVGFQRIAETSQDNNYFKAADFFWTDVTTRRSIAIGGNSENEYFMATNSWMNYINNQNGVETCNTNNMLKLTEGLFRMKPDAKYSDFYERALFNHIRSSQNPTHGGFVYFTPTHPRMYRVYSAPDVAMWCCVGTGMENHTKYGQFIYTHQSDSLFVNLFIASELTWKDKGVKVSQVTSFPDEEKTVLTVSTTTPTKFKLLIRHPYWCQEGAMKVTIGTETFGLTSKPSSYVEIDRAWNGNEVVNVSLPMYFSIEKLNNVPSWVAIKRGPIVLGSKISWSPVSNFVAGAGRMDHAPGGTPPDVNSSPKLTITGSAFQSQFKPVAGKSFTYKAPGIFSANSDTNLVFEPFSRIHDTRYMMYWNATINGDIVTVDPQQIKNDNAVFNEIQRTNGIIKFLFNNLDRSRYIKIYSLSGRKVAELAAFTPEVSFNYHNRNMNIADGTYTVQIVSDKQRITKPLCIF